MTVTLLYSITLQEDVTCRKFAPRVGQKPFRVIVRSSPIMLPLKDLFLNKEIEFDYSLETLKILYSNLNLPILTH